MNRRYTPAETAAALVRRQRLNKERRAAVRAAGLCSSCEDDPVKVRPDGRPYRRCEGCLLADKVRSGMRKEAA